MRINNALRRKMLQALVDEDIAVQHNNNTFLMFNQIKLEVGGSEVSFLKDNQPIKSLKLDMKCDAGCTVTLENALGFVKFDIS